MLTLLEERKVNHLDAFGKKTLNGGEELSVAIQDMEAYIIRQNNTDTT